MLPQCDGMFYVELYFIIGICLLKAIYIIMIYVTCIHTHTCIFDNIIVYVICIDIVDVGWASQLHNGAVCVQFDDGNQLTVYSHKSEVTFVYRNGIISRCVYTILYNTVLYYTILYCTIYTILYYTIYASDCFTGTK